MSGAPTPAPAIEPQPEALSYPSRIINVFIAPTKAFTDLKRKSGWLVPFLIIALFSVLFAFAVDKKIGFDKVGENQVKLNHRAMEQLDRLPPDQKEKAMARSAISAKVSGYGFFVLTLIGYLIVSGVLLGTFNFGFGEKLHFGTVLGVVTYASLPMVLKDILATISVFAGVDPDGFMIQNPVATNLGALVDISTHPALFSLLSAVDVFKIWTLILGGIGIACVSKVKRGTAISVCFGYYALLALVGTGIAAMFM